MVASLLRLLHSGPQDQRLQPKGNPDISAFQSVLKKTGRFTKQWHRLDFARVPDFAQTAICRLPVKGELLSRLYLIVTLPDIKTVQEAASAAAETAGKAFAGPTYGFTNSIGHALIQNARCDIGGNRVEELDGRLMEVIDEFNTPLEKVLTLNDMIGRVQDGFSPKSLGWGQSPLQVAVPIPFWFNRGDMGAVLPIDALNVDPVQISITFRPLQSLLVSDSYVPDASIPDTSVEGSRWFPYENGVFYQFDLSGTPVPGIGGGEPVSVIPGVQRPSKVSLGDTYFLAEYIYLDKPEANRFRINDLYYPISQHNTMSPVDTYSFQRVQIPMEIQNPVRHIYFYANRYEAPGYNAFFLATRDLSGNGTSLPWWSDCKGLSITKAAPLIPGFAKRYSEPFTSIELIYEGDYVRYSTDNCALFRSILPSLEEKKAPWHHRFMYTIPMGIQSGLFPASVPMGEANFGRLQKKELRLSIAPLPVLGGPVSQNKYPRFLIYSWVETYNILKVFGGRGTLLFGY